MKILAIVPMRKGSKRIPNKNVKSIAGLPLYRHTLDKLKRTDVFCGVLVTTDYEIVDEIQSPICKVTYRKRPDNLCTDESTSIDVVKDAVDYYKNHVTRSFSAICLLQVTSPLTSIEDIEGAVEMFKEENTRSLYSGYNMKLKSKGKVYNKLTAPIHFQRNGAIFITKLELVNQGIFWNQNVIEYEMPFKRSIDIDDEDDFKMAEALIIHERLMR